tara:strand:+ start:9307 stop:9576 length:270 start_codon:yes stop_codon:yes gene_type:complete
MNELKFRKLLDSLDQPNRYSYEYVSNCTDEHSKGAKYEFYIFKRAEIVEEKHLVASGMFYKSTHEEMEQLLRNRFKRWALKWNRIRAKA